MVVLPDHLHLMNTLPKGNNNFATRLMLIKYGFSRQIPKTEKIKPSRELKRERVFGKDVTGSILFVMKLTLKGRLITFTAGSPTILNEITHCWASCLSPTYHTTA